MHYVDVGYVYYLICIMLRINSNYAKLVDVYSIRIMSDMHYVDVLGMKFIMHLFIFVW
jgi:hypothetical protein